MNRTAATMLIGATTLAAAAAGTGVAIASSVAPHPLTAASPSYSWYRALMTSYSGAPAASAAALASPAGYRWMFGGAAAPGWMTGARAPSQVITRGADPAQFIGLLAASAPGPRVSRAAAAAAAAAVPAGAVVSRAANSITFTGTSVRLTAVASPSAADYMFQIGGLTNPAISVPAGAHVTIRLVNASPDAANGLVILPRQESPWFMPAASAPPAFPGAALWFLGDPTPAGLHAGTISFTASAAGRYTYACPCPGHAQSGMAGDFTVTQPA